MKVKAKDPSKVYWDKTQDKVIHGKKTVVVKATGLIRELINSGALVEVFEDNESQVGVVDSNKLNPENTATGKAKENTFNKSKETA